MSSPHQYNKLALATGALRYDFVTELVYAYQAARGLVQTGCADEATLAALDSDTRGRLDQPPPKATPMPPAFDESDIEAVTIEETPTARRGPRHKR